MQKIIDKKTNTSDIEVQLIHESSNKNADGSNIYIATTMHLKKGNASTEISVQSSLYETIFRIILNAKNNKSRLDLFTKNVYNSNLSNLCKIQGANCNNTITSIISKNFIINNIDPGFYSWLDLNVGYKLYWILFHKEITISSEIFNSIKAFMNIDVSKSVNPHL